MWRSEDWPELRDKAIQESGISFVEVRQVELGADTMLKVALPVLEEEIRAHTSVVSAEAIIKGKLWQSMLKE